MFVYAGRNRAVTGKARQSDQSRQREQQIPKLSDRDSVRNLFAGFHASEAISVFTGSVACPGCKEPSKVVDVTVSQHDSNVLIQYNKS